MSMSTSPSLTIPISTTLGDAASTVTAPITSDGGGQSQSGGGGRGGPGQNNPVTTSASLYLYTFLATLLLLLSVSAAIIIRSCILRRRHQQVFDEAVRQGILPPGFGPGHRRRGGRGSGRGVDLSKVPVMLNVYIEKGNGEISGITTSLHGDKYVGEGGHNTSEAYGNRERCSSGEHVQRPPSLRPWNTIRPFSAEYIMPESKSAKLPARKKSFVADSSDAVVSPPPILALPVTTAQHISSSPNTPLPASDSPSPPTSRSQTRGLVQLLRPSNVAFWQHRSSPRTHLSHLSLPLSKATRPPASQPSPSLPSPSPRKLRVAVFVSMPSPGESRGAPGNLHGHGGEQDDQDLVRKVEVSDQSCRQGTGRLETENDELPASPITVVEFAVAEVDVTA